MINKAPPLAMDKFGRPIADNKQMYIEDYLLFSDRPQTQGKTDRQTQNPILLMIRAIGSPMVVFDKTIRLVITVFNTFYLPVQRKRLQRLKDIGFIEKIPSQLQLWFGAYDMLRYFISPGAASYYRTKNINFTFHQLLRFLNDPSGIADPIGIRVPRDTIICHLLEVVHANPIYDLQLLDQFEDGLEEMQRQTQQMIAGTHPRQKSISAITEDKNYHSALLEFVKKYRQNPAGQQMLRASGDARSNPRFLLAECMFGTLPSAFRYFNGLPNSFFALLNHAWNEKVISPSYCDEWIVRQFDEKGLLSD